MDVSNTTPTNIRYKNLYKKLETKSRDNNGTITKVFKIIMSKKKLMILHSTKKLNVLLTPNSQLVRLGLGLIVSGGLKFIKFEP